MQEEIGGAREDRTPDLVNAIHALSQLSYGPIEARNLRERPYSCQQESGYKLKDRAALYLVVFSLCQRHRAHQLHHGFCRG